MVERLGEMRKRRKERIEKGSRERIEKRERDKKTTLRCSHCFFKSSGYDKLELKFLQAYKMHYSNNMS